MRPTSFTTRLLAGVLGLWLSLGAVPAAAYAQAPRPAKVTASDASKGKVRIDALVVHASNASSTVDPRLSGLRREMSHLNYTGMKVLTAHTDTIAPGQTATVSVVGGRRLRVAFIERNAQKAKVRIQLFKGSAKVLDTTVSVPRDRAFVVAGPKHEGGVLVFPVSVSY